MLGTKLKSGVKDKNQIYNLPLLLLILLNEFYKRGVGSKGSFVQQ